MLFESLYLKNFLSYEDQKFLWFDKPGLTLIEGINADEGGSNGSGKSGAWDGLAWGIFGETLRGLKGDDIVRRGASGGRVEVRFASGGNKYRVVRGRKDKEYENRLVVFKNDVTHEKGTIALTQDFLLAELGIDLELFRNTIIFAQGETFNFVSATNKEQKEILSKVMKLDFDQLHNNAKASVKSRHDKIRELEQHILILRSHQVEKPDDAFRSEIEEWEVGKRQQFSQIRDKMGQYNLKAEELQKNLKDVDAIAALELKVESALAESSKRHGDLSEMEYKLKGSIQAEKDGLKKLSGLKDRCHVCRQKVEESEISDHRNLHLKKIAGLEDALGKVVLKKSDVATQKMSHESSRSKLMRERMAQDRDRQILKEHRDMIKELESRAKDILKWENPWLAKKEDLLKKQEEISNKLKEKEGELETGRGILAYYDFWVSAFGDAGIKSFLFDLVCSTLTERANHYANLLTNGHVAISFDTQSKTKSGELREKFDCSVVTDGKKVKYEAYSGGEKRRISLAVDLALSDLMADYYEHDFNIVVFDEQTSYMDRAGRECFMKLLREKSKSKRVFVVDHDAEFKSMFDESWLIRKSRGVSVLEA